MKDDRYYQVVMRALKVACVALLFVLIVGAFASAMSAPTFIGRVIYASISVAFGMVVVQVLRAD